MKMFLSRIMPAVAGTILSAQVVSASPVKFHVNIASINHLKGQSVDLATASVWTNSAGADVSLVFDPSTAVDGVTIAIPAGATPFTAEIPTGESREITFSRTGLYRFALVFADGSAKSGELAVAQPAAVTVDIVGVAFAPKVQRIKAGQTVRWINTTTMTHTVTTDPALARNPANAGVPAGAQVFHSGDIAPGAAYTRTLTVPGEYKYFCKPHEAMGHVGTIVVEP